MKLTVKPTVVVKLEESDVRAILSELAISPERKQALIAGIEEIVQAVVDSATEIDAKWRTGTNAVMTYTL